MRAALIGLVGLAACGGHDDITDVVFGETTFVVVLNPGINDDNDTAVAAPGPEYAGVDVYSDDGRRSTRSTTRSR